MQAESKIIQCDAALIGRFQQGRSHIPLISDSIKASLADDQGASG